MKSEITGHLVVRDKVQQGVGCNPAQSGEKGRHKEAARQGQACQGSRQDGQDGARDKPPQLQVFGFMSQSVGRFDIKQVGEYVENRHGQQIDRADSEILHKTVPFQWFHFVPYPLF